MDYNKSKEPGKSPQTSFPPMPKVPDSKPDGRGTESKGRPMTGMSSGSAKVDDSQKGNMRAGLVSGGKGQSVADKV